MEALKEEVHKLKMTLDLKNKMELDFQEENDRLRQNVINLEAQLAAAGPLRPKDESFSDSITYAERSNTVNETIDLQLLKAQLLASEEDNARLREKIDIFELTDDNISSICTTKDNTLSELTAEIDHLKEKLELSTSEKCRFENFYLDREAELEEARMHIKELQTSLRNSREEMGNALSELESMRIQSGTVENSRGNSLFSELEDRRVRAEKLVLKQQSIIEELKQDMESANSEWRRRIMQIIQATEAKYSKRDTQIISELYSQCDHLSDEVSRLNTLLEDHREDELEKFRQANKLTEAFRPEENNQQKLISTLNSRIRQHKYRADRAESFVKTLRSKLLTYASARYDLSHELAQQRAMYDRLVLGYQIQREKTEKENKENIIPPLSSMPSAQKLRDEVPMKQENEPIFRWELQTVKSKENTNVAEISKERQEDKDEKSECIPS